MKKILCALMTLAVLASGLAVSAAALTPQEAWDAVNRSFWHRGFHADWLPGGNILGGFWVWQDGEIVLSQYRRGYEFDTPQQMWSGTKPFLSALTAIAIQMGYIENEHQLVIDFFPDAVIARGQESKRDMTIFHLLTMTSGLPSLFTDRGAIRPLFVRVDAGLAAFQAPQRNAPGEQFRYCQGGPATLALVGVVERATRQNLYDFARQYLFDPLGMESIHWTRTQSGSPIGGFGLYISPRDLISFGRLHLQDGVWNGRRLLPPDWVTSLTPEGGEVYHGMADPRHRLYHVANTDAGWSIRASGMGGNQINILIEHNTLVVRMGHNMGYQTAFDWLMGDSALFRQRCWLWIT